MHERRRKDFPTLGVNMSSYHTNSSFNKTKHRHRGMKSGNFPEEKKHKRRITFKRVILFVIAFVILYFGYTGVNFAVNMHKLFGGSVLDVFRTAHLKGSDTGRINILVAGNSSDDSGHQGADLTDSIMILSVNTKNSTAYLLSVPRDLYVNIPGNGWSRINAAYDYGVSSNFSESGYPNGGMGLLEKVISKDFNLRIDYYALINYSAIRDAVNSVGGITVNIQSTDPRGLYDPSIDYTTNGHLVNLSNGLHKINGQQALDLARARGDAYGSYGYGNSDFTRTENQRMMILALKSKVLSAGTLSNPFKLANLFMALSKNIQTDINLPSAHSIYNVAKKVDNNNIQSLSFQSAYGKNLLTSYITSNGQDTLIPRAGLGDYSQIRDFISSISVVN
jgi:LCP family protein required for cell wall assembly